MDGKKEDVSEKHIKFCILNIISHLKVLNFYTENWSKKCARIFRVVEQGNSVFLKTALRVKLMRGFGISNLNYSLKKGKTNQYTNLVRQ